MKKAPYKIVWDNIDCCDGFYCNSLAQAKSDAMEIYFNWIQQEREKWEIVTDKSGFPVDYAPTEEQKEEWDYMIYNCSAEVYKYDRETGEYIEYWYPTEEELNNIGWKTFCDC